MTPGRWSVWLANLDPVVGSERTRPVLVLSEHQAQSYSARR